MDPRLTLPAFTALLVLVGLVRLVELRVSRRHRAALADRGAPNVAEPHFRLMVIFHTGLLVAAGLEAWITRRPLSPALAAPALAAVLLATGLRFWVVRTMGVHWNVQIVDSTKLGVVSDGPFRFVRHPNYDAVFLELCALPLVHGAWITALVGAPLHAFILYHRVRAEEAALMADEGYRRVMGPKPRFLPGFARRARRAPVAAEAQTARR